MSHSYRVFNTDLRSDFPLPELPESARSEHLISVKLGDLESLDSSGFEVAFEWLNPENRVVCWCERRQEDYLVVFPGHCRFHISAGVITCFKDDKSTLQMLRHLLLDQIIPRYLASSGKLILHASAVTLEGGKSIAFIGNSGFGKSTLASSFHENGAILIGDDSILVDFHDDGIKAVAGYKSFRLFPDSVSAVFKEGRRFTEYTTYSDKQQMILSEGQESGEPGFRKLDALFLLEDPREINQGDSVSIGAVPGAEAMMALIHCAFSLDPSDKQLMIRNFRHIGRAISGQIDVFKLRYPREHSLLRQVRAAVLSCVNTSKSG